MQILTLSLYSMVRHTYILLCDFGNPIMSLLTLLQVNEESFADQQSTLWVERCVEYLVNLIYVFVSYSVHLFEVLPGYFEQLFQLILLYFIGASETLHSFFDLAFSDFQIKLLQVFVCILTIHIVAICIAWKIYSERITQRFLKPSHYQISNEQLKTAASELKLPAEHTPRW